MSGYHLGGKRLSLRLDNDLLTLLLGALDDEGGALRILLSCIAAVSATSNIKKRVWDTHRPAWPRRPLKTLARR